MTLKKYDWSDGAPVTARDLVFWMNLAENEKNQDAAYVPGGWMDHVASYSAPSPSTFVLKLNQTYNPTYLLYNGLATLTPLPQAVWDKTSATGAVGNYDETAAGAKKVYAYLNQRVDIVVDLGHQPALAGGGRAVAPRAEIRLPGHRANDLAPEQ